jgi:hypothetical protein
MSKPLYACTVCAEDFTRNSSAKRHRRVVHNGSSDCVIVRFVEYLVGRESGSYPPPITPPRLSRKSGSMKFQNTNNNRERPVPFPAVHSSTDEITDNESGYKETNGHLNYHNDPTDEAIDTLRKGFQLRGLLEEPSKGKPKQQINTSEQHCNSGATSIPDWSAKKAEWIDRHN